MMDDKELVGNKVIRYQNTSNNNASKLVENNISYSILQKILKYNCRDIYTNNESLIICYSNPPYPIWVWCKDLSNHEDVLLISDILQNNYLSKGKYSFVISEELLEELKKVTAIFNRLTLKMVLLAYELTSINKINYQCDGCMRKANYEDLEILSFLKKDASYEMEGFTLSLEECKNNIIDLIENDNLYVWVNNDNEIVATANTSLDGKYAKIGLVYTIPSQRRKGYAINLVQRVSQMLLAKNLTPILYTDGGYNASNECYKKIGYKQVGKLVKVEN